MSAAIVRLVLAVASAGLLVGCGGTDDAGQAGSSAPAATTVAQPDCSRADWPGPWTECPEAEWVRRVVRDAGYRVSDETGSALVADGRGTSFYIWTTERQRPLSELIAEEHWNELAVVAGSPIYGDPELWRFWDAQGFIFWVKQGPSASSVLPRPVELSELVTSSKSIPAPR